MNGDYDLGAAAFNDGIDLKRRVDLLEGRVAFLEGAIAELRNHLEPTGLPPLRFPTVEESTR